MINIELKKEDDGWWKITTDKGVDLGRYRPSSVYNAKEWCTAYLSSWNQCFNITVVYNGKNYSFDDDFEAKSST